MATPFGRTVDGFETVRHQPSGPLSPRQRHRVADPRRRTADQPVRRRSPFSNVDPQDSNFERAAAVHPGGTQTELGRYMDPTRVRPTIDQMNKPQGAATSVWAGVAAPADEIGGRYCENCHVGEVVPEAVTISTISEGVR